jgi:hypothetical protein
MLKYEKVQAFLHGNNRRHFEERGIPYSKRGDVIWVYPEFIPHNSNVVLPSVCEYCYKDKSAKASSYWQYKDGVTGRYCCKDKQCRSKHNEFKLYCSNLKTTDEKLMQICGEKRLKYIERIKKKVGKMERWYAICECQIHQGTITEVAFSNLLSKSKKYHCDDCKSDSKRGAKNPSWNPDKSDKERNSTYWPGKKSWKKALLKNDNNSCVVCRSTKNLEGHHLYSKRDIRLRADCDNGVILCRSCHRSKDKGYHHWKKGEFSPDDFIVFLEGKNVDIEILDKIKKRIVAIKEKIKRLNELAFSDAC